MSVQEDVQKGGGTADLWDGKEEKKKLEELDC